MIGITIAKLQSEIFKRLKAWFKLVSSGPPGPPASGLRRHILKGVSRSGLADFGFALEDFM